LVVTPLVGCVHRNCDDAGRRFTHELGIIGQLGTEVGRNITLAPEVAGFDYPAIEVADGVRAAAETEAEAMLELFLIGLGADAVVGAVDDRTYLTACLQLTHPVQTAEADTLTRHPQHGLLDVHGLIVFATDVTGDPRIPRFVERQLLVADPPFDGHLRFLQICTVIRKHRKAPERMALMRGTQLTRS